MTSNEMYVVYKHFELERYQMEGIQIKLQILTLYILLIKLNVYNQNLVHLR